MSSRFGAIFADVYSTRVEAPKISKAKSIHPKNERILGKNLHEQWYQRRIAASEAAELLNTTILRFYHVQVRLLGQFRAVDDINALLVDSLPSKKLHTVLATLFLEIGKRMLGLPEDYFIPQLGQSDEDVIPHRPDLATQYLRRLVEQLCAVGLDRPDCVSAYATAASESVLIFTAYHFLDLNDCAARRNNSTAPELYPAKELPTSIEKAFFPFLSDFLSPLLEIQQSQDLHYESYAMQPGLSESVAAKKIENSIRNVNFWYQVALRALCQYRLENAYSIIAGEDGLPKTLGLLDIRDFCKDVGTRNKIATRLMEDIRTNLLQPGTSSVKILDSYMLIIKTLTSRLPDDTHIDPSNVLLSHSAFAIREFLKDREDAPRIVISSLLEPRPGESRAGFREAPTSSETFSGQISLAMYLHSGAETITRTFEGADLLDMEWTPTVESVENYIQSRSKNSVPLTSPSALRHIITFAPLDVFVEQLERTLAERLLKSDQLDFNVEMNLLKILQADFGDPLIQSCENMLHDMMESAKWNEKIRWSKDPASEYLHEYGFQAKILSHSSWQTLQWEKGVKLANDMEHKLRVYEGMFGSIQDDRRLDWIKELGRVTVELELEDRTVVEEVTPLQAAVVHQFSEAELAERSSPISFSVDEIESALEADEAAIRAALQFWVAKVVLQPSASNPDMFSVIEKLSSAEDEVAAQANAAVAAASAVQASEADAAAMPTQADLLAQHADTYSAYIVGMLTNMGAMEVQRIHSMLTMLAPGGFAFEVDDLLDFLNDMSSTGQIERAGALWRIVQS